MKRNLLIVSGLAFLAVVCILTVRTQTNRPTPKVAPINTVWLGYPVIGQDSMDMKGFGPGRFVDTHVQLGLRDDGVVVWRIVPRPH